MITRPRTLLAIGSLSTAAGGTSAMLAGFVRELTHLGLGLTIACQRDGPESEHVSLPSLVSIAEFDRGWPLAYGPNSRLATEMARIAERVEVVHSFGLWRAINRYAGLAALAARKPLLVSPQGMLAPTALGRSALPKAVAQVLWQRGQLRRAACLHATSEGEVRAIREAGFTRRPVAMIPNGVDLPTSATMPSREMLARLVPKLEAGRRFILYLGRLHPFKGILDLLTAWDRLGPIRDGAALVLAGPEDSSITQSLSRAIAAQSQPESILALGIVHGSVKTALLANAVCLVLPSQSENFGMAVAESLAHGRPAIANVNAPWAALREQDCGWWIDAGTEPLVAALSQAFGARPSILSDMGQRGRSYVETYLSWGRVGQMMADLHEWIAHGGPPPGCVTVP